MNLKYFTVSELLLDVLKKLMADKTFDCLYFPDYSTRWAAISLSQRYCGDENACHSYGQSEERFLGHSRTLGILFLGRTDSVWFRMKSLHFR